MINTCWIRRVSIAVVAIAFLFIITLQLAERSGIDHHLSFLVHSGRTATYCSSEEIVHSEWVLNRTFASLDDVRDGYHLAVSLGHCI
jgi:hypothetical protein